MASHKMQLRVYFFYFAIVVVSYARSLPEIQTQTYLTSQATDQDMHFELKQTAKNENQTRASVGWGIIEVSPNAFMSIVYKETFRVNVYRQENVEDPSKAQYYYSPALIIDPTSAVCSFNNFNNRYEVTFSVIMWDNEFEEFVLDAINKKVGSIIPRSSLRTLPVEVIRIDSSEQPENYEIMNQWTSYASQPAIFKFRLRFQKNDACIKTAVNIKENPEHFTSDLTVYYSLQTQRSSKRRIQIKAEHAQNSNLFSALEQKLPGKDIVYMQSDDVKQLTLEIATSVIATEVTDEEFVSQDQSLSISNLLEGLLKIRPQSTEYFDAQMWDSVFWNEENARPDKVTESLNELYNKSNEKVQEMIKNEVATESGGSGGGGFSFLGLFGANGQGASSSKQLTKEELENLYELLTEHKEVTQWKGEAFVPKPLQLSRTNLATLRLTNVITTVQVSVTKTVSELSTRMNILDSSASVSAMIQQREELNQLRLEIKNHVQAPTGTIRMIYSASVPSGWLKCDGSAINCNLYAGLCSLVGKYTPDFRGRVPVMYDSRSSYANVLGAKGGAATHTLSASEMPAHQHDGNSLALWSGPGFQEGPIPFYYHYEISMNDVYSTLPAGGSQPHNNLQPFLIVEFVIKT